MGRNVIARRVLSPSAGVLEVRSGSGVVLYAERFSVGQGEAPARRALATDLMQALCAELARATGTSRAR